MPSYAYLCEPCEVRFEKFLPVSQASRYPSCPKCGKRPIRDFAQERFGGYETKCWPMYSDAMGVHPSQASASSERAAQDGVPTKFDPKTGQAVFTGPEHYKNYCETYGYYARNGGYRDPQKGSPRARVEHGKGRDYGKSYDYDESEKDMQHSHQRSNMKTFTFGG